MALFETTASALDSAQASLAPPVDLTIAHALHIRASELQTRERSLKPHPKPKPRLEEDLQVCKITIRVEEKVLWPSG